MMQDRLTEMEIKLQKIVGLHNNAERPHPRPAARDF